MAPFDINIITESKPTVQNGGANMPDESDIKLNLDNNWYLQVFETAKFRYNNGIP